MKDKTNMDIYIDKEFKLLEGCDFENNGSIKINDVVWTAKSENGQKIEKNWNNKYLQNINIKIKTNLKIEGTGSLVETIKEAT